MTVFATDLGFRELSRLTSFINFMVDNEPSELEDCTISYDLKYDEPVIHRTFSSLYAIDFNVGFDNEGNAEYLD